ncbi:hypothetical protein GGF46_004919 [Coemansia sp. RSA 552]|nr:hypothetical protein GGF46_004919 [Coemansia sp. RSA 552]
MRMAEADSSATPLVMKGAHTTGAPPQTMDIGAVRAILQDLDQEGYHRASRLKLVSDDVWPARLEDVFIEAVQVFATVGQKKYQMEETYDGDSTTELVGRNDIVSRFIYMKTRLFRSRKQVSSHLQVWRHCKKPPSSRNMSMPEFERLKAIFRQHYSRPTAEPDQARKKIRRVVSAGSVALVSRRASRTRNALGISSDPVNSSTISPHKRGSPFYDAAPAKRCRRVVSELPALAFTPPSSELGAEADSPVPGAGAAQALWSVPPQQLLPLQTPLSAPPVLFGPLPDPADSVFSGLTAATIAAMSTFDSSDPGSQSAANYMAGLSTLLPPPLQTPKPALSTADAISAFASAIGFPGPLPNNIPYDPAAFTGASAGSCLPRPPVRSWTQPPADAAADCPLTSFDAMLVPPASPVRAITVAPLDLGLPLAEAPDSRAPSPPSPDPALPAQTALPQPEAAHSESPAPASTCSDDGSLDWRAFFTNYLALI